MAIIYYAHPMVMYHRLEERQHLRVIRDAFPESKIINPARFDGHPDKRSDTLGFCHKLIDKSHALVFCRLFGQITCGVGDEINYALRNEKEVFELRPDYDAEEWEMARVSRPVRYITRAETLALYRRFKGM